MSILPLALCLLVPLLQDPPVETEPAPPPVGFASPETTAAFVAGISHFERAEFDLAKASFKTSKKGAKGDAKKQVSSYEKAVKGAAKLSKIEKKMQAEKWRAAFVELGRLEKSYGKTPLELHLEPLRETIEGELFLWLATFEADPPEPESKVKSRRPDSTKLNSREEYVQRGKHSLRWNSGSGPSFAGMSFGMMPLAAFDGSIVEEYRYLEIYLYSTDENFGKFTLYFGIEEGGPGSTFAAMGGNLLQTKCFVHHITVKREGWHHIRVDLLKELPKNNNLEWSAVTGVALMTIPPSHPKTIYIDSLRLERP